MDPAQVERPDIAPLERLGWSSAFADQLLALLDRSGWPAYVCRAFAGGCLVIATSRANGMELRGVGENVVDATLEVMGQVGRYTPIDEVVQLEMQAAG